MTLFFTFCVLGLQVSSAIWLSCWGWNQGFMSGRQACCQLSYILRLFLFLGFIFTYSVFMHVFCVYIGQRTSSHFPLASVCTHAFTYSHIHSLMPTPPSTGRLSYLLVVVHGFSGLLCNLVCQDLHVQHAVLLCAVLALVLYCSLSLGFAVL